MIKFESSKVMEKCCLCGVEIETFDHYYILDDGKPCHDFCFDMFKEANRDEPERKNKI